MREFVVGDIHGCLKSAQALIKQFNLTPGDHLVFLGDYVDRGPNSSGTLDWLIELQENRPNTHFLRGNHEQILLNYNQKDPQELRRFLQKFGSTDLLDGQFLHGRFAAFIQQTKHYRNTADHLLVHAGFNCEIEDPFTDLETMLWVRNFQYQAEPLNNKKVIHGHVPTPLSQIKHQVVTGESVIKLDNGCVYDQSGKELGHLCGYELHHGKLFTQQYVG